MYKVRKMITTCLALVLVFAVAITFTGCGKSAQPEGTTTPNSTAASTTEQALPPVELEWYIGGDENDVADLPAVLEVVNKTLKEKINATLKLNLIDFGTLEQKMDVKIGANEVFDMCFTSSWANVYSKKVSKGAYVELDELLKKYGQNILSTIPEKYWDAARVDGKLYGILNYQMYANVYGITGNKALMDKYGVKKEDIKKLEDLEPFMAKVKEGETGVYPLRVSPMAYTDPDTGALYWGAVPGSGMFVVNENDPELKVVNLYETKAYRQRADLVRKYYLNGFIRKDGFIADKMFNEDVKAGKYALWGGGNIMPGNEESSKAQTGLDVYGIPLMPPMVETSGIMGTMTGVSKTSKNPERAVMFYDLLFSDKELYNTLVYGIENKHYKKISENTVELIPDSGYNNTNAAWEMGNSFSAYLLNGTDPDVFKQRLEINDNAQASPLLGFNYNTEPMKTELAALNAVYTEAAPQLLYGIEDPEKFLPGLIEKGKKAGFDKVRDDVQAKIDEWRKANGK